MICCSPITRSKNCVQTPAFTRLISGIPGYPRAPFSGPIVAAATPLVMRIATVAATECLLHLLVAEQRGGQESLGRVEFRPGVAAPIFLRLPVAPPAARRAGHSH